jgi:serine/threonine protein kinase
MDQKLESFTSSAKLHILTHISNALRFLSERGIAHLDLSPNNIIVVKDFLIKLIDFGEAYHKNTSKKYAPGMSREYGRFVYSPGRTFPYAPPETSSRFDNFSSQQDMYSLGIIMHQLLFGSFPFICHQDTHKKLYLDRTYP